MEGVFQTRFHCYWLVLLALVGYSLGLTLKRRVEFLELQVTTNLLQTKKDIMEIREMINDVNTTVVTEGSTAVVDGTGNVQSEDLHNLAVKVDSFVADQTGHMEALKHAFIDEKLARRLEKPGTAVEVKVDEKSKMELENDIKMLTVQLHAEKLERNVSESKLWVKVSDLTEVVNHLSKRIKDLEQLSISSVLTQNGPRSKPALPCPAAWIQRDNLCFLYAANETVIWEVANMRCHDYGGILAEPDDEESMLYLMSLAGTTSGNNVWLGATDEVTEGEWAWVASRKKVTFFKWESGQPNNLGGNQDCLEMFNGHLNDERCEIENQFVCQRNALLP